MAQVYDFIQYRIRRLAEGFAADLNVDDLDPVEVVMAVLNQTQGLNRSEFETLALASVDMEDVMHEPLDLNSFYLLLGQGGRSAADLIEGEVHKVSGGELENMLEGWTPIPMGWVFDAMETHDELFRLIYEHGVQPSSSSITTRTECHL